MRPTLCGTRCRETKAESIQELFPTHPTYQNPIFMNFRPLFSQFFGFFWFFGFGIQFFGNLCPLLRCLDRSGQHDGRGGARPWPSGAGGQVRGAGLGTRGSQAPYDPGAVGSDGRAPPQAPLGHGLALPPPSFCLGLWHGMATFFGNND